MLRIVNKDGLSPDFPDRKRNPVITIEKNNPLFNDPDKFIQDLSYPLTFPFTPINDIFFGMGRLIEASTDVYLIEGITFYAVTAQMIAGNITYRQSADGYSATLEPNYAAINSLVKNIRMTEIRTEDSITFATGALMMAHMLDTAKHPEKYPYIFFPVYNPGWPADTTARSDQYSWINHFDIPTQSFFAQDTVIGLEPLANCPFWKLTYVFKVLAAYLGLTPTGNFFTDPDFANEVIYTRRTDINLTILPSMTYMPNMPINDFVKFCRQRFHLSIDPDLLTGTLTIETYKSIKGKANVKDLTKWLVLKTEQEVPAQQSFTVTLKSDTQDAAFQLTDSNGNSIYPPEFTLIAGDGDTALELDCSTVKHIENVNGSKYPWVDQSVINNSMFANFGLPGDISLADPADFTTLNNWPLRTITYLGFQSIGDGKFYPNAIGHNLNNIDAEFYKFLNDSKRILPNFQIPAPELAGLKVTDKFCHRETNGTYVYYLAEKFVFDAGLDSELVPVKFYGRTLRYLAKTNVSIVPYVPPIADTGDFGTVGYFKACFDPAIHGITFVQLEAYTIAPDTFSADPIEKPTNRRGAGGVAVPLLVSTPAITGVTRMPVEVRIKQGQPKYILFKGVRHNFARVADYYSLTLDLYSELGEITDMYTIFY